jgi:hypothetical protein
MASPRLARKRKAPTGSVLIEVMIAVLILSIGLVGVVGSLRAAFALHRDLRARDEAVACLQELVARVQVGGTLAPGEHEGQLPEPGGPYRWRMLVEPFEATPALRLGQAQLEIRWGPGSGHRVSTSLLVRLGASS